MEHKYKIGVLCFSLMPATNDLLNRLTDRLNLKKIQLKAFPLVEEDISGLDVRYSYRPTKFSGRFWMLGGRVPEGQLLSIQSSTILQLVKECNLIILLGLQSVPAMLSVLYARILRKPVLTINQAMPPAMEKKRPWFIRWSKKFVLHMAQLHIAQTKATEQTLHEIYGIPHDHLMYAPFDGGGLFFKELLKHSPPSNIDSIRNQYSTPHDAVVFIYVGTLIYLKGVDILIDAFAGLQSSYPHAYLWIVGADGRSSGQLAFLQSQVRKLSLSSRVMFTGKKSMKELIALYGASDVFALPSRKDVWPKVLVEAALTGLPLITTSATGSAYSLVRDGINGFVVPPDDADCLSRAMLFLTDSKARTQMGKNTRKIVEEFVQPEMETDNICEGILRMLKVR